MEPRRPAEITHWLRAWRSGDPTALDRLTPLVYQELHQIAQRYMRRERLGQTIQATVLVNEAYMRLVELADHEWHDRVHFFAVSAQIMRRILVDAARARTSAKRGSHNARTTFHDGIVDSRTPAPDLIALDDALEALSKFDPRKARAIELRFFAGLKVEEIAEILQVSPQTVLRDWKLAKAWLAREISEGSHST
jgi:RNA polymerase sigma factor (TIGR02999 family)